MTIVSEPLETRIEKAAVDKERFISSLCAQIIKPSIDNVSYLKLGLVAKINDFLKKNGVVLTESNCKLEFDERLYTQINKEPLKRVGYGILNSGGIPKEIFAAMTNWENLYFLAGIWTKKSTPLEGRKYNYELLKKQSVPLIVCETIRDGIVQLEMIHHKMFENHKYKSPNATLPYKNEILARYYSMRTAFVKESKDEQKQPESAQYKLFL